VFTVVSRRRTHGNALPDEAGSGIISGGTPIFPGTRK